MTSPQRKKCFPKLSRLRKDLWSWHSDVESLMQEIDAPKRKSNAKNENTEDKMNSKCLEMIHKLCKFSELSTAEILQLLKDIDIPRPISRFASSGQLVTNQRTSSPSKSFSGGRARSLSPERRKPIPKKPFIRGRSRERTYPGQQKPSIRGRSMERKTSPDRGTTPRCLNATWTQSESSSFEEEESCKKHLTFDEDDQLPVYQKPKLKKEKQRTRRSPSVDRHSKQIIKDLEEQIVELEKENGQLNENVEKLEQEVQWYKENRDYWIQYCRDNDRLSGKSNIRSSRNKGEYAELRNQYEHLQRVYENICHSLNKGGGNQHFQQLQSDAARYRSERNNARLQVQEMTDKLNWYKYEMQDMRTDDVNNTRKPRRRYNKKYII